MKVNRMVKKLRKCSQRLGLTQGEVTFPGVYEGDYEGRKLAETIRIIMNGEEASYEQVADLIYYIADMLEV